MWVCDEERSENAISHRPRRSDTIGRVRTRAGLVDGVEVGRLIVRVCGGWVWIVLFLRCIIMQLQR